MSTTAGSEERELLLERLTKLEVELATVPELYERLDGTLRQLELTNGELGAAQRERDRISTVVESMSHSISWRITSPLRKLMALARR